MSGGRMDASVRGGLKFSFLPPFYIWFSPGNMLYWYDFCLKKHFEKQKQVCCKERSFYSYFFFFLLLNALLEKQVKILFVPQTRYLEIISKLYVVRSKNTQTDKSNTIWITEIIILPVSRSNRA